MAKYPVLVDGEAITIKPGEILRFACCDCGLIHNMAFAFEDGEIGIAIERNKRATGQKRRHMKRVEGLWQHANRQPNGQPAEA